MEIVHIYGAWVISLQFYDYHDTESESQDIEKCVARKIFTHKNIKGYIGQKYQYSTRWEQNIVSIIHIYGARYIYLLFCDYQDTESE